MKRQEYIKELKELRDRTESSVMYEAYNREIYRLENNLSCNQLINHHA